MSYTTTYNSIYRGILERMDIIKSEDGNYHIAANKDEWFIIHFFMNFFNENYDEIDEGILFHFGVEEEVASIAKKVNNANIPDRDEYYLVLEDYEMELFGDLLRDASAEQTEFLSKFENNDDLRNILRKIKWQALKAYIHKESSKDESHGN